MSHSGVHPRLRAYAAAVLWSLVHGHQGVKAAINKPAVLQELQAMHQEFSAKASVNSASEALGFDMDLDEESLKTEQNYLATRDMEAFTAQALEGVLTIVQ